MQFPSALRRRVEASPRGAGIFGVGLLAVLAYVPALLSSPGRLPADTKLYLYLDPGGLFGRAASTFEPDQFAGWVPHQQITYLWPSGPWFWVMDAVGVADWVAHRLWIATIMVVAGLGVRWTARLLGLSAAGALVAAMVYQLSPFLLPYVSRTSLLLLPWAGLGWIVGLTVRATREPAHSTPLERWRDPALIALVVATVGSGNATALALIVPAPVLWLLHARTAEGAARRHLLGVAAATAGLCASVSVWWVAMLVIQSRYGAPVLTYSETLADVSRNATGSEALRGLGYWLFYVRDPVAPTTTASIDYLVSTRAIAVSYAVVLFSILGLAVVRWPHRRFAATLVAVGLVLAVGVHPIDSSSPLMSILSGDGTSGLALALRSSTRATPVMLLGLALGGGALITALPRTVPAWAGRRFALRLFATAVAGGLVILNLPALWSASLVDPAIDRDADVPSAWLSAAASLDERSDGFRTMQLPGAEFGAFRWGYTVDQPLVALTDRPLVTRDLLPLGSGPAMDLLYAFDDRWQAGVQEAASIAPVARLFGVDTLWLTNDIAFERFRGPRPEEVDRFVEDVDPVDGLGLVERFGEAVVNTPDVAMIDPTSIGSDEVGRSIAPVAIADVIAAQPVIRAKTDVVVLSGSGDGVVDAAAAGLLDGHELIRYSASLDPAVIADATSDRGAGRGADARLIVTDSNRDRAYQWRGSQDVVGHTEPGGPADDVLISTAADRRLDVFDTDDPDTQTIAIQDGPVSAQASSYGEPFAYRPEDRAAMSIDGDPSTAWLVGDHGDPVGEFIELTLLSASVPLTTVALRQPIPSAGGRSITQVSVGVDGGTRVVVDLDESSFAEGGQQVDVEPMASGSVLDIRIEDISVGDPSLASSRGGVGFSEIDFGMGPTVEWIRPPVDAIDAAGDVPLDVVLTRLRVDPADPWRSDPEPRLRRQLQLAHDGEFIGTVTLRLDRNASDTSYSGVLDDGSVTSSGRLRGGVEQRGAAAVDGDRDAPWVTPFDGAVGSSIRVSDAVIGDSVTIVQPDGDFSPITDLSIARNGDSVDLVVPQPDADGLSTIDVPAGLGASPADTTLTITAIDPHTTIDRRYGDVRTLPAAIAEVGLDVASETSDGSALGVRADCDSSYVTIDGVGVPISFAATADQLIGGEAVVATFCEPVSLSAGRHRIMSERPEAGPLQVDRLVLSSVDGAEPSSSASPMVTLELDDDQERRVRISACVRGCWVVLGEGFNPAWSAEVEAGDLGPPELVDGGFNGWWIAPTDLPTSVVMRWTAQQPVTTALWWSLGAVALAVCLVVGALASRDRWRDRHRRMGLDRPTLGVPWGPSRPWRVRPAAGASVVLALLCGLLISPVWSIAAAVLGAVNVALARWQVRVFEVVGACSAVVVAASVVWIERRDAPFPDAGWTVAFEHLNGLAIFAVLAIACGSFLGRDA